MSIATSRLHTWDHHDHRPKSTCIRCGLEISTASRGTTGPCEAVMIGKELAA